MSAPSVATADQPVLNQKLLFQSFVDSLSSIQQQLRSGQHAKVPFTVLTSLGLDGIESLKKHLE